MDTLLQPLEGLGRYQQFIIYILEPSKNRPGKYDKKPIDYKTKRIHDAHDKSIWTDFQTASRIAKSFGNNYGVGFVLTPDDPFFFIDIDNCYTHETGWSKLATEVCAKFSGCAVEVSSSQRGLHIIGSCKKPITHRVKNSELNIEFYTHSRFIALTGIGVVGDVNFNGDHLIPQMIEKYFFSDQKSVLKTDWRTQLTNKPRADWNGSIDDDELIQSALNQRSVKAIFGLGATFKDLWEAKTDVLVKFYSAPDKTLGYDGSRADAALAQHLAFWTGCDGERMIRLMKMSKLARDKWKREDYLPRTVANACSQNQEVFSTNKNISAARIKGLPEPLPEMPEVMPFKYEYLPDALREYVRDISERMQCPPDFAAVAGFIMIATLCGRKIGLRPMKNNDWTVIPNLWAAVIGNSGVMKSPTLNEVLLPLKKLAAEESRLFQMKMEEYAVQEELKQIQQSVRKSEIRQTLKNNGSIDEKLLLSHAVECNGPFLKRFITNNSSYEALGEILIENPNGILIEADELIGLLKQLDASGQEVARSFYLTAADGDKSYTFDRIMRGKGLHIEAVCLSIIGGIQPGVLAEYVRQAINGGAGADGLLQRFGLIVYPDISLRWKEVDRLPDKQARIIVDALVARISDLNPSEVQANIDPYGGVPFLRFNKAAQKLFSEWREKLECRIRSNDEHPAIISHLAKYRKLVPSLALLNHLCDLGKGEVNEIALQRAIEYSQYLESHAKRVYSFAVRPDIDTAKILLKRLSGNGLSNPFTAREVYKKGWTGLSVPEKAKAAINLLIEYGHLISDKVHTDGRPIEYYYFISSK